jgi:hypothetical protein
MVVLSVLTGRRHLSPSPYQKSDRLILSIDPALMTGITLSIVLIGRVG